MLGVLSLPVESRRPVSFLDWAVQAGLWRPIHHLLAGDCRLVGSEHIVVRSLRARSLGPRVRTARLPPHTLGALGHSLAVRARSLADPGAQAGHRLEEHRKALVAGRSVEWPFER